MTEEELQGIFGLRIPFTEYIETYRHLQVSLVCKTKYIINGTKHEGEMQLNALNLMFAPELNMTRMRTPAHKHEKNKSSSDSDTHKHEKKQTIDTS